MISAPRILCGNDRYRTVNFILSYRHFTTKKDFEEKFIKLVTPGSGEMNMDEWSKAILGSSCLKPGSRQLCSTQLLVNQLCATPSAYWFHFE